MVGGVIVGVTDGVGVGVTLSELKITVKIGEVETAPP
jgi:hypothetical protein